MPIYEYECSECHNIFEITQSMSDAPLTICSTCSGPLKKLISRSAFHLKGGGWYADGYGQSKKNGDSPAEKTTPCSAAKSDNKSAPSCPKAEGGSCPAAAN